MKKDPATIIQLAAATGKVRTDSFAATLAALGHTLALVLPLPWFFIGAGMLLGSLASAEEYTLVVGAGLQGVGHALLFWIVSKNCGRVSALEAFQEHDTRRFL